MKKNFEKQAAAARQLLPTFALWSLILLAGCASKQTSPAFTAVRVSNYRGETISEYTARGTIWPVEGGFKINAVERWSPGPERVYSRFPYGWETTVVGPRIHHWRTDKPYWLSEQEDAWLSEQYK